MYDSECLSAYGDYTKLLALLDERQGAGDDNELLISLSELSERLGIEVSDEQARGLAKRRLKTLGRLSITADDGHRTSGSALLNMRWSESVTKNNVVNGAVRLDFSATFVKAYRDWEEHRDILNVGSYRSLRHSISRRLLRLLSEYHDVHGRGYVSLYSLRDLIPLSPQLTLTELKEVLAAPFAELAEKGFLERHPFDQYSSESSPTR